ncbi:YbaB/EbfC family nucleoid-associated protein [Streptomyces sp. NPDC001068]|uniref:YbaB/EbfC family nucleoid-associated protein n=1 Tax=Streptomyces sp. NPDC001068 TaxID=3364544 RepID=UPI0036A51C7E
MNTPPGSRLERALADFAEQQGVLARAREQMRVLSVTARSRDGVVEVTVDAEGHLVGISFVDGRFRELKAPRLGDSVLEAVTTARAELAARATAVMLAADLRPPSSARAHPEEAVEREAAGDTPSVCWRRLVREAHVVAAGPAPVRELGVVRADGAVDPWEASPGVLETARPRPQGPLWGRSRPGVRSPAPHTPLSAELFDAVMALRAAVCGAVSDACLPSACGYVSALERPRAGVDAAAKPA